MRSKIFVCTASALIIAGCSGQHAGLLQDVGAHQTRPLVRQKGWLLPLRDAFAFLVWLASFFPQRIHWRGRQFRIRRRKLVPVQGPGS